MKKNKIIIHDFCAHPFTFELAGEFKKQTEDIHYLFTNDDVGPKADFKSTSCPYTNISVGYNIPKNNPLRRLIWEIKYAFLLRKKLSALKPNYLICSNTPVIILLIILIGQKFNFVWWVQDIFSEAAIQLNVIPKFARYIVYKILRFFELIISMKSSAIILISEDFKVFFKKSNQNKITIIENWPSSQHKNLIGKKKKIRSIIYAGTIGFKHGKDKISKTIKLSLKNNFKFILISEGKNAEDLKKLYTNYNNFEGYDFLPYKELIKKISMSSGALFVLENSASRLSIPSKAYTYFLCNTPVLGLCNPKHHLAKAIKNYNLGMVNDLSGFIKGIDNQTTYNKWIINLNSYSRNFNIKNKYKLFRNILNKIT